LEAARPGEGDLKSAQAANARVRDLANAENEVARKEALKNIRQQSATGGTFGGNFANQRVSTLAEIDFLKTTQALRELQYVGDATGTRAVQLREEFQALDQVSLANLRAESEYLGNALKESFQGGLTTLFQDLIEGTKSASEAFGDFALSMIQDIGRIAAQLLAQQAVMALFGGAAQLGGGRTGGLLGLFGGLFKEGGTVGEGTSGEGTSGDSLLRAIAQEGAGARVIVAHEGERLLSAKTGDAQAFAAFEKSGAWDLLKKGRASFSSGGTVGTLTSSSLAKKQISPPQTSTPQTLNLTMHGVKDYDSFRKSQSQIHAALQRSLDKSSRY
jgi:hypothetical protein